MVKQVTSARGYCGLTASRKTFTIKEYQDVLLKEDVYTSTSSFLTKALFAPVTFPDKLPDCISTRSVLMANAFGLIHGYSECPRCGGGVELIASMRSDANTMRFKWGCKKGEI